MGICRAKNKNIQFTTNIIDAMKFVDFNAEKRYSLCGN